jgi:hypothetical protein
MRRVPRLYGITFTAWTWGSVWIKTGYEREKHHEHHQIHTRTWLNRHDSGSICIACGSGDPLEVEGTSVVRHTDRLLFLAA